MHAIDDRLAFAPPQPPGLLRAFVLAVLAHLLLVLALTSGLNWKRDTQELSAEAELWAAVPQEAAPREVVAPPPPPPVPVVKAPPVPEPPLRREADIALEREQKKREAEQREAQLREAAERRQAQLERERLREEAERKREQELAKKKEQEKLAAAEKKRKEDERKRRQEQEEARVARQREENLKRIQGMAGGTGAPTSTGTAARSAGPSTSWAGRVRARVRPNIVFADDVAGNPMAEVEVRMAPDGTIVARRLVKSSGSKSWDDAVLRALDKTEVLPRDVDGRVHSPVVLAFRPKD